ncbi:MAG TPA: hypothetical protein VHU83_16390 [Bryobacteraceae bacterium]|jgi:hypothetical protein|nr:hypothetical protein [Bryobacteraceae bacterium]
MPDESTRPPEEENPGHSTAPRDRKFNRLTHGCRSEQILIPGEDPAEFEFLINGWLDAYDPQDPIAQNLVEELAKAHWFLKRNEKWLHQIQTRLPYDAWLWTDENHKLLANTMRYKTTAERAFFRWYKALETHYNREFHRNQLAERARARAAELSLQWLDKKQQLAAESLKTEQFAHILGDDQVCATTLAPTNQQIKDRAAARPEPPKFITRVLHFRHGVPRAYDWVNPDLIRREFETIGVQTMLYTDWLAIVQREEAAGTGHLGPAPSVQFLSFPPDAS